MSDPALICEVRTDGGVFRDWLSVTVAQSFDATWQRNFRLICAEPNRGLMQRLVPGARVDIALAEEVVIKEGYIVNRQAAYDANRHAVVVEGYSKAGLATEGSVDSGTGQYRGYTLDAIANSVLKTHGLKFRIDNAPDSARIPFPNVMVRCGESPFEMIARLCNQRGLWLDADADGTLVANWKDDGSTATFVEGQNILSAECSIQMPAVYKVIADSQTPGSDSLFGKRAAEIQATSNLSAGIPGLKRKILAEMPLDQQGAIARTNMEAQAIEASRLRVNLTYQGWRKPGTGKLWNLRDNVSIKSPMLFPTESGRMELKLWGYVYSQDAQGGTTTSIECVNRNAFAVRSPDGNTDDGWYKAGATPAVSEKAT
jgi:prophage tail gpP-like protein